jgi:hypothetical protein
MTEVLNNLFGSETKTGSTGYHGGIVSDVPEMQLQKCSDFKVDFDPNLYKQAGIKHDPATARLDVHQSIGVGAYHLDNMYGCECGLKNAREIQISQPAINFDGGKGWMGEKGCLIENDSNLRFQDLTNLRFINQLPNLQNAGFYGKGDFHVDDETILQGSNITRVDRPCNILSGVTIENLQPALFPMNNRLKSEVQDPKHIIPEDSMNSWVRGGLPSRQIARNVDYINRCEDLRNNGLKR